MGRLDVYESIYTRLKKQFHVKTINHTLTMRSHTMPCILPFAYTNTRLSVFVRLVTDTRELYVAMETVQADLKVTNLAQFERVYLG